VKKLRDKKKIHTSSMRVRCAYNDGRDIWFLNPNPK
jgi:hypothetical protein